MMGDLSGRLATMLAAMPYAVAAKFAFPDRPVVCTIGDGAFQMLGMNELITIKKYMEEWSNKQLVILVLHNDDLTQVSWEMRTEDANPRWKGSQDVQTLDYARYADVLGFQGDLRDRPQGRRRRVGRGVRVSGRHAARRPHRQERAAASSALSRWNTPRTRRRHCSRATRTSGM